MKIRSISANYVERTFGRALTGKEEIEFSNVCESAKKELGVDEGVSLFKVFPQSFPQGDKNTGIGKLNSDEALEYLKFMKLYTGSNAVKIYPTGQMPLKPRFNNYYCLYERSGVVFGEDNINLYKLSEKEYGSLLSEKDLSEFRLSKRKDAVDYENELEGSDALIYKTLRLAYKNLYENQSDETVALRKEFENYKSGLNHDIYDRLAIAPFVSKDDPELFVNFDKDSVKQNRFEAYKTKYETEIDLYKFGKFLALKNLKEAKENLKKEGLELYGDCPVGYTGDEAFAFPDAFYPENVTPGWGFRAIKYEDISKEGTEAHKLFKEKISGYLENFDGIRFDVGWQYFSPKLLKDGKPFKVDVGTDVIDFIEQTAKEIKGDDYDTKKLMYEADAGPDDFQIFDWSKGSPVLNPSVKGRTPVLTSVYESAAGYGWGNADFYKRAGLNDYMTGTNNHDSTPLRILAEDDIDDKGNYKVDLVPVREQNKEALQKSLHLGRKFLSDSDNFVKAKFAELFLSKNHFLFFNDVVGNKKRTDAENINPDNYRIKISDEYEREYHTALQQNRGFNLAESLKLAMKAKGINKTNPILYSKICKYSRILRKEGAKTKAEAENQIT